jgi:ethanolamine permease
MAGPGAFAATPFAIWFFLAIEGVANVAEEAINPQRTMLIWIWLCHTHFSYFMCTYFYQFNGRGWLGSDRL